MIFHFGNFVWNYYFDNFRLAHFASDFSLDDAGEHLPWIGEFRLGASACDLSRRSFRLNAFAWDISLDHCRFLWNFPLGNFRSGSFAWTFYLGSLRLEAFAGIFNLDISHGDFRLEPLVWDLKLRGPSREPVGQGPGETWGPTVETNSLRRRVRIL